MTQSGWIIRRLLPFDDAGKSINWVGNYEHTGRRYLDDIVVFSGIYGICYMKWYVHKDLVAYNFDKYSIELKLYKDGDLGDPYYVNKFRIIDVDLDTKSDRYVCTAISQDTSKLFSNIIDLEISSLPYDITRTPQKILEEVLEDTGLFAVIWQEHDDISRRSFLFQYPSFTFDPLDTVFDFIDYIANENNLEWYIKGDFLFIGPELKANNKWNAEKPLVDPIVDHISISPFGTKINFSASPLDINYHYDMEIDQETVRLRCVWAKHTAGFSGDITKGNFVPIGTKIEKWVYRKSLKDEFSVRMFDEFYFKPKHFNQMRIGRIMTDSGESSYVDKISVEKDGENYAKKIPRDMKIQTVSPLYTLERVGRTAEYLDNGAGQLFPRVENTLNSPNSIVYAINDRIEQAVVGPFVMGNGSPSFQIIDKDPDDYRFTLPNGWTMYVKGDGTFIMDFTGVASAVLPTENVANMQLTVNPTTSTITINAPNIKLGGNATLGVARLTDSVSIQSAALTTFLTGLNAGTLVAQAAAFLTAVGAGSHTGTISSASSKSKTE